MGLKISEVAERTGIAVHRIEYALRKKQIVVDRPDRRWARHWYAPEEVQAICKWFGVRVPESADAPTTSTGG
jgi:hypothetical protein